MKYFFYYTNEKSGDMCLYSWMLICLSCVHIYARVTFDIALVVVFLQQAAVVGQFFVFVRVWHELRPGRGAAAFLRDWPARHTPDHSRPQSARHFLQHYTRQQLRPGPKWHPRGLPRSPHFRGVMPLWLSGRSLLRSSPQCGFGRSADRGHIPAAKGALASTLLNSKMRNGTPYGRYPQIWPTPAEFSSNPNQTHLSMLIRVIKIIRESQVGEFDQGWS